MPKRILYIALSLFLLMQCVSCNNKEDTKGDVNEQKQKTVLYQVVPEAQSLLMCYVIKTNNNKIIVIDGGIDGTGRDAPTYLLYELQKISGEERPVIEAWFITHPHRDHYYEFVKMVDEKEGEFTVKNIYLNFPSTNYIIKHSPGELTNLTKFREAFDKVMGKGSFDKYDGVQAGEIIEIDNVVFEILQIPDESIQTNAINNSSLIFRMTVEGQTVLFTGDAGVEAGDKLIASYGDAIQSDIVQMSHHGQAGLNENHYARINPKVCLWPTPIWLWENTNLKYDTNFTQFWMFEKLGVKHHYIAGLHGTEAIEFPFDFEQAPKHDVDYD